MYNLINNLNQLCWILEKNNTRHMVRGIDFLFWHQNLKLQPKVTYIFRISTQKNHMAVEIFCRILFEFLPEKLKDIRINTIFQLFWSTLFREIDNNEILRNSVEFWKFRSEKQSSTTIFGLNWDSSRFKDNFGKKCLLLKFSFFEKGIQFISS